ncbi:MAG: bifunctional riboflavin kinase/FAD synthetase [Planctomycetes bacterium]|nr:bifunctional riboflavin kinase/FAD synthetase [Planctomycetota bacterium]
MQDTVKIIRGLENVPAGLAGCVLTIGNFDGVHVGHQSIIARAASLARSDGQAVTVVTFDPPPDLVLRPDDVPEQLTAIGRRCELLGQAGADTVVLIRATRQLLDMPAEQFIEEVILDRFRPRHVVEGPDFFFGRSRAGNVALLGRAGREKGFQVHVVEPLSIDLPEGSPRVSSTLIRRLALEGRVEDAARCLGRPFELTGLIVAGQRQGRMLEFPTANLESPGQVVPGDGIYAGLASIEGASYPAAVSIGVKPTFGPSPRTVEANLIDAAGDFYGKAMTLHFFRRLRGQVKFESVETLKAQITRDVEDAKKIARENA